MVPSVFLSPFAPFHSMREVMELPTAGQRLVFWQAIRRSVLHAPLIAVHACKAKMRYRYWVSQALQTGTADTGVRVPAAEVEGLIGARIAAIFGDGVALLLAASRSDAAPWRLDG